MAGSSFDLGKYSILLRINRKAKWMGWVCDLVAAHPDYIQLAVFGSTTVSPAIKLCLNRCGCD
jgi:hypothetical protein